MTVRNDCAINKRMTTCLNLSLIFRLATLSLVLLFASCATSKSGSFNEKTDVILRAVPISSKVILAGASADAIEMEALNRGDARYIIQFKIDEVERGQFTEVRKGGPSAFQQAREAAQDRNLWKILTFDYSDPEERLTQGWVSVAVYDPEATFGIVSSENLPNRSYRLFLKRSDDRPDSYFLLHAE